MVVGRGGKVRGTFDGVLKACWQRDLRDSSGEGEFKGAPQGVVESGLGLGLG